MGQLLTLALQGRERATCSGITFKTRDITRTNDCIGRVHSQAFWTALDDHEKSKILPNSREPQLQHGEEYGTKDLQPKHYRELDDDLYGRLTGFHCSVLLPGKLYDGLSVCKEAHGVGSGSAEGLCMIDCMAARGL
jgi:hypothetical protein